jgi:hypothetical protein
MERYRRADMSELVKDFGGAWKPPAKPELVR